MGLAYIYNTLFRLRGSSLSYIYAIRSLVVNWLEGVG